MGDRKISHKYFFTEVLNLRAVHVTAQILQPHTRAVRMMTATQYNNKKR